MFHRLRIAARLFVILILLLAPTTARARPALDFTIGSGLTNGAADGSAAWGDIDNDNKLDLVITGTGNGGTSGDSPSAILFRNTGSALAEGTSGNPNDPGAPGFKNVEESTFDWADYDGDGYLDALLAGVNGLHFNPLYPLAVTAVYHNSEYTDAGVKKRYFADIGLSLPGIYRGRGAWGDYDNDGRPDFLLTGRVPGASGDTPFTALYHNDTRTGGSFSKATITLPALGDSYAAWGDYNRDGWLDFALMGKDASGQPFTAVYRNDGSGGFTALPLVGQSLGALAWADVDSDGDLDLLVSGSTAAGALSLAQLRAISGAGVSSVLSAADGSNLEAAAPQTAATRLYLNNNGTLTPAAVTGLPALWNTSMAFGDYDNDGDPDLLLNGQNQGIAYTGLWINNGTGQFSQGNPGVTFDVGYRLSLAWGDFDRDYSLDALVTGIYKNSFYGTNLYINAPAVKNMPPPAPLAVNGTHYAACWAPDSSGKPTGGRVVLRWNPPADTTTKPTVLTYNVRAGTAPGSADLLRPAADLASGANHLAGPGNAAYRASGSGSTGTGAATLTGVTGSSKIYWAVSAVDASYAAGPFTTEQSFIPSGKIASPDNKTTPEETPITVDVASNDNLGAKVFAVDPPAHGTTALDAAGQIIYTPALNFAGLDKVTYYAIDPVSGVCNMADLTITVTNTPDAPSVFWKNPAGILQPGPRTIRADQGKPYPITLVATDPDLGEQLTWSISTPPQHGSASVSPGPTASGAPVTATYTPSANYTGSDTFTVKVQDSTARTAFLVVQVTVTYSNHLYFPFLSPR